ncbi:transcriptional regulator [Streptomyces sp. ME19-01-6]|uniref:transcriptional regulator n=1 Tax=Streptomyces sp. ME19-01-6 TaxID=3028686 RepID=UPI0029B936B2|nr:transcriptional regulator [Streptomyces sp. ME19-01-6]MDX3233790.1 transcriptional regulator [Streptomyces sp. ME19-01-6]
MRGRTPRVTEYGFSHEDLAEEVNRAAAELSGKPGRCTDRHVRRWVSGEVRWPWPAYLRPLTEIFGRTPQQMGFVPRGASSALPPTARCRVPAPDARKDGVEPVQRRSFIAASLAAALGVDQLPRRGRLGVSDVARIQRTITRLDAHFNGLGGGAVIDVATDYLTRLQHASDHCAYGEQVERELHRAVADVAACAGWSAHDCGRHNLAAQLRNTTLQAALLARDSVSVTRAWSDLAAQADHAGRPAEAARINRTALTERHLREHPLITALLHARLADYLAQTGDSARMGRHLAAAERVYDRAHPAAAASWLAFLTPAELSGLGAIAHQSAGQYARAEQHAGQALGLLAPRFTRNRAYCTVLLAELQLAQGHASRPPPPPGGPMARRRSLRAWYRPAALPGGRGRSGGAGRQRRPPGRGRGSCRSRARVKAPESSRAVPASGVQAKPIRVRART